jgi:hypothetical protein
VGGGDARRSEILIEIGKYMGPIILEFLKAAISGYWVQDRFAWHGISSREISGPVTIWRSVANVFLFPPGIILAFWRFGEWWLKAYELGPPRK